MTGERNGPTHPSPETAASRASFGVIVLGYGTLGQGTLSSTVERVRQGLRGN